MPISPPVLTWTDDVCRLFDVGGRDHMRVVGGAVRDMVLGRITPETDIDFATTHEPDAVTALLEEAGIAVKPTGLAHGTVTAIVGGKPYEITTLRQDVETDGRRAVIAYTKDWAVDAARRDFTMNALYADADGRIEDPTGQGLDDIHTRLLRFIGDAPERIREDYLRILRLFRFLATLEGARCEPSALEACADLKDGLRTLSAERVTAELEKLFGGANAGEALRSMEETGVSGALGLRTGATADFMHLNTLRPVIGAPDPLLGFYLAFGMQLSPHIRVSKRVKIDLGRLAALADTKMSWQEVHYRAGADIARALFVLRCVRERHPVAAQDWAEITHYVAPVFPVKAQELEKEGFFGPSLGNELKKLENEWLHSIFGQKNG